MSNVRLAIILGKVIVFLGVFSFGLLFLVQNIDVLKQSFTLSLELFGTGYKWAPTQEVPYYYLLIGAFAFGGLVATAFFLLDRLSYSLKVHRLRGADKKNIQVLTSEISRLRSENMAFIAENEKAALNAAQPVEKMQSIG